MKADIVTIFPDFFRGPLQHGITRRAAEMGLVKIEVHDLRQFTHDRHRTVDDRPFGGGEGMVLKPEPLFECLESLRLATRAERIAGTAKQSVIVLSAQGQRFTQTRAAEFRGMAVPEVLVNGNHLEIRRWRREQALKKTLRNRPDLLEGVQLNEEDSKILARIKNGAGNKN